MVRLFAALAVAVCWTAGAVAATPDAAIQRKLAALSVPFVPNAGQWDSQAAFAAQLSAGTLFVTGDGQLVYRLPGVAAVELDASAPARDRSPAIRSKGAAAERRTAGWVLSETLVDAQGRALPAPPRGQTLLEGKSSFAIGSDESLHRDGLSTYERLNLGEVWPGIEVQLRATGNNVEKIFTVAPARDARAIRLQLGGTTGVELGAAGELIAHTGNGPVAYTAPIAYQVDAAGRRNDVAVRYALDTATARYGFTVGAYDERRPLIIDPLLQSTYLGGNGSDAVIAMAVHPVSGEVYVAGFTGSTNFPKVAGAEQTVSAASDGFVTRLNATLTARLQSTYLGGSGDDQVRALAIHPVTGEVYVAGSTSSTNFPKVAGAEQSTHAVDGVDTDAFVTRLNAALTVRLQSTYLGGNGADSTNALAIHPVTGEIYVAGVTGSTDFPNVAGAEQTTRGIASDGFVTRLNAALTDRLQSTYLGGNGNDVVNAIAIHPATGEVYVAGYTESTDFPKVAGAEQTVKGNDFDVFVTRLNAALTTRLQSTYLGGNADDVANALAIHPSTSDVYVTGYSASTDLPKVAGSEQPVKGTGTSADAFVTRLNAPLTIRLQSTY
ncbi:MAG: SBBP repeat-containing protein, partial [Betaproteobacteria bacterium]